MVLVWFRSGSGMVQVWFRYGSGMVQVWFRYGSGMVQVWFRSGSGLVQIQHPLWQVRALCSLNQHEGNHCCAHTLNQTGTRP